MTTEHANGVTAYDVRTAVYRLGQPLTVDEAEELLNRLVRQRAVDLFMTCAAAGAAARYARQRRKQARLVVS